jgi:hypothetical protein
MSRCYACFTQKNQCRMCESFDEEGIVTYIEFDCQPFYQHIEDDDEFWPLSQETPHLRAFSRPTSTPVSKTVPEPFGFPSGNWSVSKEESPSSPSQLRSPFHYAQEYFPPFAAPPATPVKETVLPRQSATPVKETVLPRQSATPVKETVLPRQSATPVEQVPGPSATPVEQVPGPSASAPVEQIPGPSASTPVEQVPGPSASTPVEQVPGPSATTPVESRFIPFAELPTPLPSPKRRTRIFHEGWSSYPDEEEEEEEGLSPIQLFQSTPSSRDSAGRNTPRAPFSFSPSTAPFYLQSNYMAPPTATEEVHDFEEEEEEEQVFLDPLKMDAGSTPFRRKQKNPRCKRNGSSGGWVKIKTFKTDLIF